MVWRFSRLSSCACRWRPSATRSNAERADSASPRRAMAEPSAVTARAATAPLARAAMASFLSRSAAWAAGMKLTGIRRPSMVGVAIRPARASCWRA